MKNLFTILFSLCATSWAFSQATSTLFHEDKVVGRDMPTSLNPAWAPFYHGVASGDPLEDRVIIWTRVTPESMDGMPVEVSWKMATDPALSNVVASGDTTANADRDYTVKVDVTGLESGTTYYYGFTALGKNSLTGKTKTTPLGDQSNHLKFGVVSCNNFEAGYFNGFQRLADRMDLDAVIHLGDYIYEQAAKQYGDSSLWNDERVIEPEEEIVTLEQYRARYSTYRLDTMLARAHQQHPFITVWDDHESANDSWAGGAEAHNPNTEGPWEERLSVAKQVYFEWMPVRDNQEQSVYRSLSYGNLLDLIMLDTRIEGREQQINDVTDPALQDPNRTILGSSQKQWLKDQLIASTAKWKVIGQQVIFSPFAFGWAAAFDPSGATTYTSLESLFLDIWDGYPAERQEIVDFISTNNLDNVVILTGDFHTTFSFDVTTSPNIVTLIDNNGVIVPVYTPSPAYNPSTGEGSVAVEFATPSVTSANFDENLGDASLAGLVQSLINNNLPGSGNPNPHLKYVEMIQHGYYVLDVKEDGVQGDYFFTPIEAISSTETFGQGWRSNDAENHLEQAGGPAVPKAEQDTPAPADPPLASSVRDLQPKAAILGVYPNPFSDSCTLHYSLSEKARATIELVNSQGQVVKVLLQEDLPAGVYTLNTQAADLPAGAYVFRVTLGNRVQEAKVVLKR